MSSSFSRCDAGERFDTCNRSRCCCPLRQRPPEAVSILGPPIGTCRELPRLGRQQQPAQRQEDIMFGWAITFLVIALIAGLLGFGVVAGTAFAAAKIIFVVALIAFLISGVLGITGRGIP